MNFGDDDDIIVLSENIVKMGLFNPKQEAVNVETASFVDEVLPDAEQDLVYFSDDNPLHIAEDDAISLDYTEDDPVVSDHEDGENVMPTQPSDVANQSSSSEGHEKSVSSKSAEHQEETESSKSRSSEEKEKSSERSRSHRSHDRKHTSSSHRSDRASSKRHTSSSHRNHATHKRHTYRSDTISKRSHTLMKRDHGSHRTSREKVVKSIVKTSPSLGIDRNRLSGRIYLPTGARVNENVPTVRNQGNYDNFFSFMKWTNDRGDLHMRSIAKVGTGYAMGPLGCTYDPLLGFLFIAQNEIISCSEEGVIGQTIVKSLNRPSALCAMKPGEAFAILDETAIYVYDISSNTIRVVVSSLDREVRGLAYTKDGYLVTVVRVFNGPIIRLYDPNYINRIVDEIPFPVGGNLAQSPNPCFCTASYNTVYITDLGHNRVVVLDATDGRIVGKFEKYLATSRCEHQFKWVSGVAADKRYELLVADSAGRSLWSMSSQCDQMRKVKVLNGDFPYSAGIAVAPSGYLMACGRKSHSMHIFKFEKNYVEAAISPEQIEALANRT